MQLPLPHRERFGVTMAALPKDAEVIPFTAQTRISGVKSSDALIQKGAVDAILRANPGSGTGAAADELRRITDAIARQGMTPLAVARDGHLLGAVALKDVIKAGVRERFSERPKFRNGPERVGKQNGQGELSLAAVFARRGRYFSSSCAWRR